MWRIVRLGHIRPCIASFGALSAGNDSITIIYLFIVATLLHLFSLGGGCDDIIVQGSDHCTI